MQFPIERLSATDFVMCYWQAGQGSFAWLVERQSQLYFFVVIGMKSIRYEHWAYDNDRKQVDTVRAVMNVMGFLEVPVYEYNKSHKKILDPLKADMQAFDEILKQEIEAREAAEKKTKEDYAKTKISNAASELPEVEGNTKAGDNVTDFEKVKANKNQETST